MTGANQDGEMAILMWKDVVLDPPDPALDRIGDRL